MIPVTALLYSFTFIDEHSRIIIGFYLCRCVKILLILLEIGSGYFVVNGSLPLKAILLSDVLNT